jgi:hypothetical protein
MTERGMVDQALADRGPSGGLDKVGLQAGLINEDQPFQHVGHVRLEGFDPEPSPLGHLWPQDFAGEQRFFMAEAKPVQPFADRAAMHRHAMDRRHLGHDRVQRQVGLDPQPFAHPVRVTGQLALGMIALRLGCQAPRLALQDHHVVHEPRRDPEVPCSFSVSMPFLDKGDDPAPQFHRMWLAHSEPL